MKTPYLGVHQTGSSSVRCCLLKDMADILRKPEAVLLPARQLAMKNEKHALTQGSII